MTQESAPKKTVASRPWLIAAIVFVFAFDLAFVWQRRAAAAVSEFGGHPDEGAQYVTALAFQKYLAHPLARSPERVLNDFAAHYPIVRKAAWPQLFPVMQAAWMSVFGKSPRSVLLMMCALAAVVALLLHIALREEFGWPAGFIGAAIFLCLPSVREDYAMLMPELLCTAWMLAAALVFARFIERGRMLDALAFGCLAALAILTDQAGFALGFFVPLALLISGKWRLMARLPFWLGLAPALLLTGLLISRCPDRSSLTPSIAFTRAALPFYSTGFAAALGAILLLLAVPGLVTKMLRPKERTARLSAAAALLAGTLLFVILAPADFDLGRLLPAVPAALIFTVAGSAGIAHRFRRPTSLILAVAGALAITVHETVSATWQVKKWTGFRPLVELLLEDPAHPHAHVLLCSDRTGEGMFLSELAMGEKEPARVIERADSLLANTSFGEDDDLKRLLVTLHFDYVVFDSSNPDLDRDPHHDMLRRVLRDNSDQFWEMVASPVIRDNIAQDGPARLYRLLHSE